MPSVISEHRQEQIVIRQRRGEGEIEHGSRHGRTAQAHGRAEIFGVGDDQSHQFGDRDGRHAEIVPGQPQRRHADHRGDQHGDGDADGNSDQRRQCEMRIRGHRGIGAATEEHDVPDRHLAGIAADDIPRRRRDRIEQDQRAEPLLERRREQQRIRNDQRERHRRPQKTPHHVFLIRSCPSSLAAGTRGNTGTANRRRCPCRPRRSSRPTPTR